MASKPKVEVAREHLSKAQEEAAAGDLRDAVQWSFASLEAAIDALAEKHGITIEEQHWRRRDAARELRTKGVLPKDLSELHQLLNEERKAIEQAPPDKRLATIIDSYLTTLHRDDPGRGCAVPTLGPEIARESPKTRKAFSAKLEQMIDMIADQIPDVPRKAARRQAASTLATMMGTLVLSRIAGNGEFSD